MFSGESVCSFVCSLDCLESYEEILMNFFEGSECPEDQVIRFWWRFGSRCGSRNFLSDIM